MSLIYWFIGAGVIFIIGGVIAVRFLMKELDDEDDLHLHGWSGKGKEIRVRTEEMCKIMKGGCSYSSVTGKCYDCGKQGWMIK